jgi:hypothetical protein
MRRIKMDKYERIAREISKIREFESQTRLSEGIDLKVEYISPLSDYPIEIKTGEAKIKGDVVLSAWKNYCRESWLYRVLEFIGLR